MPFFKSLVDLPHTLFFTAIGILGIGFLIGFHELGHFLFAKLFSIRTPSFSIGFGPQLISKTIGETTFSISAIPLGGYVEVAGLAEPGQGNQEHALAYDKHSFVVKPFYQKLAVLFGGIMFNLLFAYVTLILLFFIGAPQSELLSPLKMVPEIPVIAAVSKDSAADSAGFLAGDVILAYNNHEFGGNVTAFKEFLRSSPEKTVTLRIKRDGHEEEKPVTVGSVMIMNEEGKPQQIGSLGVFFKMAEIPKFGFFDAIAQGIHATHTYIYMTAMAFVGMFGKQGMANIGGPLSVIKETIKGATMGWKVFLLFLAVISINLAVLNLIPVPVFDGGQILFTVIETLFGRALPVKVREIIAGISWIALLALILFLTVKDIGLLKWLGDTGLFKWLGL
jgi:regulator of sigma E protease